MFAASFGMGGFGMMPGLNPMMGMMGMGGMMPMMMMMQMMQMMQMLQMMMGGGGMMDPYQAGYQQGLQAGMGGGVGPAMGGGYGFPGCGGGGGGFAPPYMPYGGGCPGGGYGGGYPMGNCGPCGNLPYDPNTGSALANTAANWAGHAFKPGQTCRCADFVSTMIEQSGHAPPGFHHCMSCDDLQRFGQPVNMQNLKPGDVVFFGNTYRNGQFTHTGIYLGNGRFAHRPTANRPVEISNLNSPYWQQHFSGGRRLG